MDKRRIAEAILGDRSGGRCGCWRLATVDSGYLSGTPKLVFDGEATLTTKAYPYAAGYTPTASDRVLVVGGVVLCSVVA